MPARRGSATPVSIGCLIEALRPSAASALVISSAYGRAAFIRACALTMREAAMSSIALVIFLVDWTERIRRRRTRSWAPIGYWAPPVGEGGTAGAPASAEAGSA